nr:MAG TPA: hypothetical protein [Caudoviricetes sp.]
MDNSGDLWVNRGQAVDSLWIRWACGVSVLLIPGCCPSDCL